MGKTKSKTKTKVSRNIISKCVKELAPSGIRKFFEMAIGMKDIISLGVGEPDFVTPWNIRESAIYSIEKGYTSYTSNKGLLQLRTAIASGLYRRYKINYNPETEILITVGVSEGMDLAIRSLINPGDRVIIPEPAYVSYGPVVSVAGGRPVYVSTKKSGFKIQPEDIRKVCNKKTKCIILNYPANPTGISYTRRELNALMDIIYKCNLTVISDEIYSGLSYDFLHTPWPLLKGAKSRSVYLNGFSKLYAMTGWRLGYAAGPKNIIGAMTKIHQYTMLCAPTVSQIAAIEAVENSAGVIKEMVEEYRRRRQFIVKNLNRIGLSCSMPHGTFYVFCSIEKTGLDSMSFAAMLLKKYHVAVVPGTAFGPSGEGYIRISYASSIDHLKEAVLRIEKFVSHLQ